MISTESENILLSPIEAGPFKFKNRAVNCALTRCRTNFDGIPNDLHQEYYSSRTSFGLNFSESTCISEIGNSFPGCACIYTEA